MQTFLPLADFRESARVLDPQRLGKQRAENIQIYNALTGVSKGWRHHTAVRMWEGYEDALHLYAIAIVDEWLARGFSDFTGLRWYANRPKNVVLPPFIGNERFHSSHRSMLLEKNYGWYKKFGWTEQPGKGYFWPVT